MRYSGAFSEWLLQGSSLVSMEIEKSLYDLFDLCRKDVFADTERLEREIATSQEEWRLKALPLGVDSGNEVVLVESLQSLVSELQSDARRTLDSHLTRYAEYADKVSHLDDTSFELASQRLKELRGKVITTLSSSNLQVIWGLEADSMDEIEDVLIRAEQDVRAFTSPKEVMGALLAIINTARQRKYAKSPKSGRPMSNLDEVPVLRDILQAYTETVFTVHQRQAILRHDYV